MLSMSVAAHSAALVAPAFTANTAGEHKITNLFTAGPRLGYAWDRWMIYATGGWASANLKGTYCSTITGVCGPAVTSQNGASRNDGWYAGGGFDYMIHKGALVDVLLGAEYQHFEVDCEAGVSPRSGLQSCDRCQLRPVRPWRSRSRTLTIKTQG